MKGMWGILEEYKRRKAVERERAKEEAKLEAHVDELDAAEEALQQPAQPNQQTQQPAQPAPQRPPLGGQPSSVPGRPYTSARTP